MVAAGLEAVCPTLARGIAATRRVEVVRSYTGSVSATAARAAEAVKLLAPLLLLVAIGCAAGAVWLSPDRRRTVVWLGAGAVLARLLVIVGWEVGRALESSTVTAPRQRWAAAVWNAFLGDLRTAGRILAGGGAVVAAAAASLIRPVQLDVPLRRAAAWAAASWQNACRPARPRGSTRRSICERRLNTGPAAPVEIWTTWR